MFDVRTGLRPRAGALCDRGRGAKEAKGADGKGVMVVVGLWGRATSSSSSSSSITFSALNCIAAFGDAGGGTRDSLQLMRRGRVRCGLSVGRDDERGPVALSVRLNHAGACSSSSGVSGDGKIGLRSYTSGACVSNTLVSDVFGENCTLRFALRSPPAGFVVLELAVELEIGEFAGSSVESARFGLASLPGRARVAGLLPDGTRCLRIERRFVLVRMGDMSCSTMSELPTTRGVQRTASYTAPARKWKSRFKLRTRSARAPRRRFQPVPCEHQTLVVDCLDGIIFLDVTGVTVDQDSRERKGQRRRKIYEFIST